MDLKPQPLPSSSRHFSIVVPSWNNLAYLKTCIESVRRNSAALHQIVVHVNDGSDGTLAWVRSEGLEHTRSASNAGVCLAVNEAAALARHDLLLYLNDDMVCCPGWDAALLERAEAIGHDAFMLSATMIEPVPSGNRCVAVADFGRDVETFRPSDLLRSFRSLARPDWYGATWPPTLVPRRWWQAVGGFSPEFSPGLGSDNDLSMKLWAAGCRVFLGVGRSLVYHFMAKSTGRIVRNDGRRQFLRTWGITPSFFDRHYLRRGSPATGTALAEPEPTLSYRWSLGVCRIRARLA